MAKTFMQMVADARSQVEEINVNELSHSLDNYILIDVREPAEYEAGHIQSAINIPRGILESELDTNPDFADRNTEIVLMCKTGGRSALAAVSAMQLGFNALKSFQGGFLAWEAEGLQIVK